MSPASIADRIDALPWDRIGASLDARGFAPTGPILDAAECAALVARYAQESGFRSHIVMARHGFGQGEYK